MILITRPHEEAKVLEKELLKIGKKCVTDSLISFKFHFKKIPFEKYGNIERKDVENLMKLGKNIILKCIHSDLKF